jgi:hypothetical protein
MDRGDGFAGALKRSLSGCPRNPPSALKKRAKTGTARNLIRPASDEPAARGLIGNFPGI